MSTVAGSRAVWSVAYWVRAFLRVPLLYKVLVANSLIVVLGAIFGTLITAEAVRSYPDESRSLMVVIFALLGTSVSLGVNWVVLRAAFRPIAVLSRTVDEVGRGNLGARANLGLISDPEFDRLSDTINGMLDGMEKYRDQVQELSSHAITAQEEERKRISRELHDQTAQSLTSILVMLRLIEKNGERGAIRAQLAELRELTSKAIDEIGKLAMDLRPSTLDDLGLKAAVEWYARDYSEKMAANVDYEAIGFERRLPATVEVVIYRVVQEAFTNITKHAKADRVAVRLEQRADSVLVTVGDNGVGFNTQDALAAGERRSLGLFGMQERLALVQGSMEINSEVGRGTILSIEIPLDEAATVSGNERQD
jgi:two-component system sensor histidine kinase UhpB